MRQILSVSQGDTNDGLDLDIRFSGATLSKAIVHVSLKQFTKSLVFENKSKDSPDFTNNEQSLS